MKKLFLALVATVMCLAICAQVVKVYKNGKLVALYNSDQADSIVFAESTDEVAPLFTPQAAEEEMAYIYMATREALDSASLKSLEPVIKGVKAFANFVEEDEILTEDAQDPVDFTPTNFIQTSSTKYKFQKVCMNGLFKHGTYSYDKDSKKWAYAKPDTSLYETKFEFPGYGEDTTKYVLDVKCASKDTVSIDMNAQVDDNNVMYIAMNIPDTIYVSMMAGKKKVINLAINVKQFDNLFSFKERVSSDGDVSVRRVFNKEGLAANIKMEGTVGDLGLQDTIKYDKGDVAVLMNLKKGSYDVCGISAKAKLGFDDGDLTEINDVDLAYNIGGKVGLHAKTDNIFTLVRNMMNNPILQDISTLKAEDLNEAFAALASNTTAENMSAKAMEPEDKASKEPTNYFKVYITNEGSDEAAVELGFRSDITDDEIKAIAEEYPTQSVNILEETKSGDDEVVAKLNTGAMTALLRRMVYLKFADGTTMAPGDTFIFNILVKRISEIFDIVSIAKDNAALNTYAD